MPSLAPATYDGAGPAAPAAGGRRGGVSVKTLKRALKKAGLKVSGKKATLTRRAKKAHLKMGGAKAKACFANGVKTDKSESDCTGTGEVWMEDEDAMDIDEGGARRGSRKNGLVRGVYRGVTGVAKGTLRSVGRVGRSVFGRGR